MSDDGKVYGRVVQVLGPVLDVEFENEAQLPEIYDALEINEGEGEHRVSLVAEVNRRSGATRCRCVAMSTTDGVVRGMKVLSTGKADLGAGGRGVPREGLQPPRGAGGLRTPRAGEGAPADPPARPALPLALHEHRDLRDGIKVVDLLAPYAKGARTGLFGGAGVERPSSRRAAGRRC